jgi:hypothetical protein
MLSAHKSFLCKPNDILVIKIEGAKAAEMLHYLYFLPPSVIADLGHKK